MKLGNLIDCNDYGTSEIEVSSIAFDTKCVKSGSMFFCLRGQRADGHDYAEEAVENGAVCIVAERKIDVKCPVLYVDDTREALSKSASKFYGEPQKSLRMVAITGTNGKTTTAYIVRNILMEAGIRVGMIGTNGIFIGNSRLDWAGMTTPDPVELFSSLRQMADNNVEVVVMEVSAHALALKKVKCIKFDIAAFTNFSQDHLDYFGDMEKYAEAKLSLFNEANAKSFVINMDDEIGRKIYSANKAECLSYGLDNPSDVFAVNEEFGEAGVRFVMNLCDDIVRVRCNLSGRFNIYNIMCASLITRMLGVSSDCIESGVRSLHRVDGRFNVINTAKFSIIIDFAHTEDGLKNVLGSIKEFCCGKVITVFGCGGDRDKGKRAKMGKTASELSDFCIITSDNPRSENPENIINEIEKGIEKNNYLKVVDRKQAIRRAVEFACDNDVIFIAGKGAERFQEIGGVKYDYNDEDYITELIMENVIE